MPVILVNWEAEFKRIMVQGQLEQQAYVTPISTEKAGYGGTLLSSQLCGKHKNRIVAQTGLGKKQDPSQK
jgi:hypothetical protein